MPSSTAAEHDPTDMAARFSGIATALISDNLQRLSGPVGIRPFHKGGHMVGTALTVRTRPGDNLVIHQALDFVKPGQVLVVDGGGAVDRALVGGIMVAIAAKRGASGYVIDGAIRDSEELAQANFPVFARAAIHRGPYKDGPGDINLPVSIGGQVISPGDIIVGDMDGVVTFSPAIANELLVAVEAQAKRETEIFESIAAGTYRGAYGK